MTYPISDSFDSPLGQWDYTAPWDGTEFSNSNKGFLTTQSHVDIRSFRAEISESWVHTGAGFGTITVAPIAARGGWAGLHAVTSGSALSDTFTSSLPGDDIDISGMNTISVIFPDFQTFDGTSYIQFNSDANGVFGNGHDSAQVAFSSNLSIMPQLHLNVSSFAASGFDNTHICGVRIHLVKASAPSSGSTLSIMALRGLVTAWEESALDFDTRLGAICVPVTLDGAPYGGSVAEAFEFVRGDGTPNDPIPVDGAYNIYFFAGGQTSPNDAVSPAYNQLSFLLREEKSISASTGSYIQAMLKWNTTDVKFTVDRVDITGGTSKTTTTPYVETVASSLMAAHYLFRVELVGTQVIGKLYNAALDGTIGDLVWQTSMTVTSTNYTYRSGRVGFVANILTRDAYIFQLDAATTGYAMLRTQAYLSTTPVNGAMLAAKFAQDLNLFTAWSGVDSFLDVTKTISGNGSYRASLSMTTNQFIVDDWTQTYLQFSMWVGSTITPNNQPQFFLNTQSGPEQIRIEQLRPNQWNEIEIDLTLFQGMVTGIAYSITVSPNTTPDKALGLFWIDETLVGRRRVSWSIRATPNGPFREFRSLVNTPTGAVHLNSNERGTALQLQAVALTTDAWVVGFKLFPHYAELGCPVYDSSA